MTVKTNPMVNVNGMLKAGMIPTSINSFNNPNAGNPKIASSMVDLSTPYATPFKVCPIRCQKFLDPLNRNGVTTQAIGAKIMKILSIQPTGSKEANNNVHNINVPIVMPK